MTDWLPTPPRKHNTLSVEESRELVAAYADLEAGDLLRVDMTIENLLIALCVLERDRRRWDT